MKTMVKRDGRIVPFNLDKVIAATRKAFTEVGKELTDEVVSRISSDFDVEFKDIEQGTVESTQDFIEAELIKLNFADVAKAYILYRDKRNRARRAKSEFTKLMYDITFSDAVDSDMKRENANINAEAPMGKMLKYGAENAKRFFLDNLVSPDIAEAHRVGKIHQHDMDFFALTETCCQIDLGRLFKQGFYSGHGFVRSPNSIGSYGALTAVIIQANQNDQHF